MIGCSIHGTNNQVNPVFNSLFPQSVAEVDAFDYDPENPPDPVPPEPADPSNPPDPIGTLPLETRTLWFENDTIHAYNIEGRIFVEFLGDLRD